MAKKKSVKKRSAAKRTVATKKTAKKSTKKATKKAVKKSVKKTAKPKTAKKKTTKTAKRKVPKSTKKKAVGKKTTKKAVARRAAPPAGRAPKKTPKKTARPRLQRPAVEPMPLLPTSARAIPEPGQITAVPEEAVAEPVRNIPAPGTFAPDFELMDGSGHAHRLSDYQGRRVVVYFYPKDDTPGCTTEACGFRDSHSDYASVNAAVLGISPDSVESHERFAQKFALPFPLLADPEHAVVEQYGAWGAKQMYGNATMGVLRSTFIIGPDGRIEHVFENVKADGHAAEVLEYLRQH